MKQQRFDVAFSYSTEHKWIAEDLYTLLTEMGFSVYASSEVEDFAGGYLRKKLMNIYRNSVLNVILWSRAYSEKPKGSIIHMEKDILWSRHIGKSEHFSLFVLIVDDSLPPEDFSLCLSHKIQDVGLLKTRDFIVTRQIECWTPENNQSKEYKHPYGTQHQRSRALRPCKFKIARDYKFDKLRRWKKLGDVEVSVTGRKPDQFLKVYLIPGWKAPKFLAHSLILKSNSDCLKTKQMVTNEFIKKNAGRELTGVLFDIEKDGMLLPHVYCLEYDEFLSNRWEAYYYP